MALQTETPSRIWKRIQDCEARGGDMPSLPSLPIYDESSVQDLSSETVATNITTDNSDKSNTALQETNGCDAPHLDSMASTHSPSMIPIGTSSLQSHNPYSLSDMMGNGIEAVGSSVTDNSNSPKAQASRCEATVPQDHLSLLSSPTSVKDGDSFHSTASSHDLTVYNRVNASFDPATGAQGIGRFNAGKLNSYLHGLNRRLQEENEALLIRLKKQEQTIYKQQSSKQWELNKVMENDEAEQWLQEKEEMERKAAEARDMLQALGNELRTERNERQRDKDKWKGRLAEVEKGVGDIIKDLEKRATEAEAKAEKLDEIMSQLSHKEDELREARQECKVAKERAQQAEDDYDEVHSRLQEAERKSLERDSEARVLELRAEKAESDYKTIQSRLKDVEADLLNAEKDYQILKQGADETVATQKILEMRLGDANRDLQRSEEECRFLKQCLENFEGKNNASVSIRRVNTTLKQPRTPGKPLTDLSWLVDATGEASAARIMTEIERLQEELDIANDSIDDKLDKLEEAGLDVIGLTRALDGARQRIACLEKEICLLHAPGNDSHQYTNVLKRLEDTNLQLNAKDKEIKELRRITESQMVEIMSIRGEKKRLHEQYLGNQSIASRLVFDVERLQTEAIQISRSLQELKVDRDSLAPLYQQKLDKLGEREHNKENLMLMGRPDRFGKKIPENEEKPGVLEVLLARHKTECKGLFVQIRYLKAKCVREGEFRSDLAYQKHYLFVLLSRFQASERILACISQGKQSKNSESDKRLHRLKIVSLGLLFIARMRRLSNAWLEQRVSRIGVESALEDVRKNRQGGL